jgi:hypothetical protein
MDEWMLSGDNQAKQLQRQTKDASMIACSHIAFSTQLASRKNRESDSA